MLNVLVIVLYLLFILKNKQKMEEKRQRKICFIKGFY